MSLSYALSELVYIYGKVTSYYSLAIEQVFILEGIKKVDFRNAWLLLNLNSGQTY